MATVRRRILLVVGIAVVALTACGDDDDADGAASEPATSVTAAPSTSTTEPEGAAPTELQGDWVATLANGDIAMLEIGSTFYRIELEFGKAGGHLEVAGETITLAANEQCAGVGEYTWSITDGSLTLTLVNDDPCGGRRDVLVGRSFTRADT
jgi:hypothetical protein